MSLSKILRQYREAAATHRESGTYFEELAAHYFRTEPVYKDLYSRVESYADWAARHRADRRDAGIDLVAETADGEYHAIQCKLYAEAHRVQKADIDSFFTASGKKPFTHRIIVTTTNDWSEHAEDALRGQQTAVTKVDLEALETSAIDWSRYAPDVQTAPVKPKKALLPHQRDALAKATSGFQVHDRGRLIMACGTGKTFTSLKIAESAAGEGKRVLFLVPSLALLSQALTDWSHESETPLHCFAVCSDSDVGKRRKKDDDRVQTFLHELRYPATTNPERLALEMQSRHDADHMSVVFATYHSIDVLHGAQAHHGLPRFDLIICDEAHRTTGAKFADQDESHFTRVHDDKYVAGDKRMYMTATPRIYADSAKAVAERDNVLLCSMDDESLYGPLLYVLTFSEAVKRGLLVDYKVIVLSIEESHVTRRIQNLLKSENNELRVDDAAKIVGCWKALSKQGLEEASVSDETAMSRAVAFCQVIEQRRGAKTHKVASKSIASMFQAVLEEYQATAASDDDEEELSARLRCEAEHVDGSMNASQKDEKLSWLKADPPANTCRVLSNVRCLSEGVDVPALDAVLFLTPRNSQVDVVQSVGRVMRNAPGKQRGYIVLPVVIPAGMEPHEALDDNKTYRVVWQVLQALRSHDDRFDAMVNKLDLIGRDRSKMEVVAITDKVRKRQKSRRSSKKAAASQAKAGHTIGSGANLTPPPEQRELEFEIGEFERAIYAKLVQKVGNRHHWEDWAKDIAKIANTHIDRIAGILENEENDREREAFSNFAAELRDDLNDSIRDEEVIEMLAQHLVTRPVFDALFEGHSFVSENSISTAMQSVLDVLHEHHLDKETATLEAFYDSVKLRAQGIDSAEGKQRIIVELYDKFFRNAFPAMSDRLGIVYTPVEIVDFILHSVDHLLRQEFGQTLGSDGVHILDPFTGTGTFITRLLQSGLIDKDALAKKFRKEIHANEIVLLAYYIAAINIETAYHGIMGGKYEPFTGICLTDTFQLYEKDDLISRVLVDNSARRTRQKKLDIRVILGNPPYSVGQESQNDNNQNVAYPTLDARIAETYAARSDAKLAKGLYDSYVRAIRWASDRVGKSGIIGFVTNASFIEVATADGMRRCLADEFSSLYIFHLRGNQRTAGDLSRREGGKVFGSGSRAPVAISLLVKNPSTSTCGEIFFHSVGDYLGRDEKLSIVDQFQSVAGIAAGEAWTRIEPDVHGDWVKQRDAKFGQYLALGTKDRRDPSPRLFDLFSLGLVTNRDAWAYSPSRQALRLQIKQMIEFYNGELDRFDATLKDADRKTRKARVDDFVCADPKKISWTRGLKGELAKGTRLAFDDACIVPSLYRPFFKMWLYFDRKLNEMVLQMPRLFRSGTPNRVIGVSAGESRSGYSVLMTDVIPSLHAADMVGSQYFPLFVLNGEPSAASAAGELEGGAQGTLFADSTPDNADSAPRDGVTDTAITHFRDAYPAEEITKEDVFYYIYGVLHSPEYRDRYAENLGKELPRMPRMKKAVDFWAFSRAGRALGDLHVGYDEVHEYDAEVSVPAGVPTDAKLYRVEKMRFERAKFPDGRKGKDRTTIRYNDFITVRGIPIEAYEYVVNGKPAIEWVMERQGVATDKASGIVKDANDWANETIGDPRYPLSLLLRVITVSLETRRIVSELPPLDIREDG